MMKMKKNNETYDREERKNARKVKKIKQNKIKKREINDDFNEI